MYNKEKGDIVVNKIKTLSNDSKYTMWYCNIIVAAQNRFTKVEGEKHHIVPKSLWAEGAKLKENIVLLTYREHYICHRLLLKMVVDGTHKSKMANALWRLSHKRKYDNIKLSSRDYGLAREAHSTAVKELWANGAYRQKTMKNREWFYNNEEQKEANRQKALSEMQDPERKQKFVQAGLEATKAVRDEDTKAWVANSMGSEEGRAKAKVKSQTTENREACRQRELSKTKEERAALAKAGQQALVDKLGGEEAYRKYLSNRISGRKRYINMETKQVKVCYTQPDGYVLFTDYNKVS